MEKLKKFKGWSCGTRPEYRWFRRRVVEVACRYYAATIYATDKETAERIMRDMTDARLVYVEEVNE